MRFNWGEGKPFSKATKWMFCYLEYVSLIGIEVIMALALQ